MEIIILVGGLVLAAWMYSVYVGVIKTKNKVKESLASIDVQLKNVMINPEHFGDGK